MERNPISSNLECKHVVPEQKSGSSRLFIRAVRANHPFVAVDLKLQKRGSIYLISNVTKQQRKDCNHLANQHSVILEHVCRLCQLRQEERNGWSDLTRAEIMNYSVILTDIAQRVTLSTSSHL